VKRIGIASACLVLLCVSAARADSLWNKANVSTRTLYSDDTARAVGDNLTIVINEQTKIDSQTERKIDRTSSKSVTGSGSATTGNVLNPTLNKVLSALNLQAQGQDSTQFDGKHNYDDTRSLVDSITVTVQDVLPNGNLVVVGKREREVAGDKQIIAVSGVVRASDIPFNNSISSDKVANFQINVRTKGQENTATNPGWLARFINFINPS
jgi:flagellar L-ring protein precursor FlgH